MAYVPQIGEFEDNYLGGGKRAVFLYFINGKKVSRSKYFDTLGKLSEPFIKDLQAKLNSGNITENEKQVIIKKIDDIVEKIKKEHRMEIKRPLQF